MGTHNDLRMILKTLSLKDYKGEPFATLVASGFKDLETRSKPTTYRGLLGIHCSYTSKGSGNAGKILALVDLVDCFPFLPEHEKRACCKWVPGKFAYQLQNLRLFSPAYVQKGMLGMWKSDDIDLGVHTLWSKKFMSPAVFRSLADPENLTGWDTTRPPKFPLVFQNWL